MLEMKNGKLLLKKISDKVVDGGVIYTDSQKHKSFEGEIMSTSGDCGYEIGEHVIFSEFAGEDVWIDGKEYHIIDSENIWAVKGGMK